MFTVRDKSPDGDILRANYTKTEALQATGVLSKYDCGNEKRLGRRGTKGLQWSKEGAISTTFSQGIVLKNCFLERKFTFNY